MEGTGKAYRTVSWKRYLLKTESPRVKKFLESRGNEVFYQVCKAIDNATLTGLNEIVLLIHPNMKNIIKIYKKDFIIVLDRANEWFLSKEKYEVCSEIKNIKQKLNNKFNKSTNKVKSLI